MERKEVWTAAPHTSATVMRSHGRVFGLHIRLTGQGCMLTLHFALHTVRDCVPPASVLALCLLLLAHPSYC
jgi:hypothetical protein